MIIYLSHSQNPFFNLAIEEVLATKKLTTEQIMMLWQNRDTAVIGRNQNVFEEVNVDRVKTDGVNLVRRQSGGGAVFQDLGNFCYTFIVSQNQQHSYQTMINPIIKTLNRLGVDAYFEGKNDIKVDGKKISGNCQYITHKNLIHHGTILFDVNLSRFKDYLIPNQVKLVSKGIKSNRSLVTNIKPLFKTKITIKQLWTEIIEDLGADQPPTIKKFTPAEIEAAEVLVKNKYQTNEWIYGSSPEFNYRNKKYFAGLGTVEVFVNVKKNKILNIRFYGDFLGYAGTSSLEKMLVGVDYQREQIQLSLDRINLERVFGSGFDSEKILALVWHPASLD